ncbi:MAG: hypothetical protein AAF682_32190 [Planctomycetota bacterium]
MKTHITLALASLLAVSACRTPPATTEAGPDGLFRVELTINEKSLVAEGKEGRLLVQGEDRGPVQEGDIVTFDWDGEVRVNGKRR